MLAGWLPISLFVSAVARLVRALAKRGRRVTVAAPLRLGVVPLAAFVVYGSRFLQDGTNSPPVTWQTAWVTAPLTMPMDPQNGAIRRMGSVSVRTTFVTGTRASLAAL